MTSPLERLTPAQMECLRLVAQHKSSKQIAIELGLSSHAIDARIKRILANLDVATRHDAARWYLEIRGEAYQPLVCPPSDLTCSSEYRDEEASITDASEIDEPVGQLRSSVAGRSMQSQAWLIALPFQTSKRPVNDLPWNARLAWMVIILVAVIISVTLLISVAEGLSRLL